MLYEIAKSKDGVKVKSNDSNSNGLNNLDNERLIEEYYKLLEMKGINSTRPHLSLINYFGDEFEEDWNLEEIINNAKNKQMIVNEDEVRKHYQSLKTDKY